jgi:hypothetical protein
MKLKKQEQRFKNALLFIWQKFQLISPAAFTVQKYRANVGVAQHCQACNGKGHVIYTEKMPHLAIWTTHMPSCILQHTEN